MVESGKEVKSLLMKVKEESKKAGLKLNIQKTKITASGSITSWQIDGETMKHCTADSDCSHEIKGCLLLWRKAMKNLDSLLKSKDSIFLTKVYLVKAMVFFSSHVQMWELNHKEGWVLKNWCFWTMVLEKTLESPLDSKEIKPINPKENQPWIFIGSTDAKAEAPYFGHLIRRTDSWKRPWYWERFGAGGEGDNRGWDG